LVTESGTVPPPDGALFSIIADSPNPADADSCQAVGLYFPLWSEINQYSVAGIDRESGEIVYQEDRLDSLNGRAYQTTRSGWKGPEADISSEFTKRTIGADYAGILSPDHTPEGTFERLRQEFFWIFGSPQSLVESLPDLDSYFIHRQPVMPGKAHLRLMPGESGFTDGSVDVPTNQGLSWWPAIRATNYKIYLGLSEAEVMNADDGSSSYIGSSQTNSFFPSNLVSNTTYFWRVDSVNDSGISKGDVWRFTTTEAVIYPLETELTFNLGAGVTTNTSGQASAEHVKDNVLIGTGSHQVILAMTGYDPDGMANFRSVPAGVTASGVAVVTGSNNSDIGIGQGLKFDLKMLRAGIPVQNEVRFQITDFTIKGRLDNSQRDYSIISSEGEFTETNFNPNDIPVNVPEGSFSPGEGEDFSWNRVGSGGAILSLETITLKLVFVPDNRATSHGTPYSYLDQYFSGLVDDADYESADLADSDKDGAPTWKEFLAGTNPIDRNSVLSITSASMLNADTLSLTWSSVPGITYSVLKNPTLEGDEWSVIQSSILATGDYTEKTISIESFPVFLSVQVDY